MIKMFFPLLGDTVALYLIKLAMKLTTWGFPHDTLEIAYKAQAQSLQYAKEMMRD